MKYFVFLFALMFSSIGCAASWHVPISHVEYQYVYVPTYKKKVITYYSHPRVIYKKKRVYRKKRVKTPRRTIIRYHY